MSQMSDSQTKLFYQTDDQTEMGDVPGIATADGQI